MNVEQLSELAMWSAWQDKVKAALPDFCADGIYVEQRSYLPEFEQVARYVAYLPMVDVEGMTRDVEFGAIAVNTAALGRVTRMWLDSNVEIDFLQRHLGLAALSVLDIGAGYGRLAVSMEPCVGAFYCVDAVPISTRLCQQYTQRFNPEVTVLSLPAFIALRHKIHPDLAINIHSWNECSYEQVERWLEVLREMGVPWLFTVSHGQLDARIQRAYYTWGGTQPSFRPLLQEQFELVAEESIGLGSHPHALWHRR